MSRVSARSNKGIHRGREDEYRYEDIDTEVTTEDKQTASSGKETDATTTTTTTTSTTYNDAKSRDDPEYVDNGQVDADDADHEEINCGPCGTTTENFDEDTDPYGDMVQCEKCNTWQHIKCMGLKKRSIPDDYICDQCSGNPRPKIKREICQLLLPLQKEILVLKEEKAPLLKIPMAVNLKHNPQLLLMDHREFLKL